MSQYFQQIEKIICEKKTSSRVRFMLQDVVDLRKVCLGVKQVVDFISNSQMKRVRNFVYFLT